MELLGRRLILLALLATAFGASAAHAAPGGSATVPGSEIPVPFTVGGVTLVGHHYRSTVGDARPRPVIVMAHGFGLLQSTGLAPFAERFADAGYDAFTFDYRSWGESGGQPRDVLDIGQQLRDWRGAVAFARTLPGVDPARVVLWGSSFSGGHVLAVAADDHAIAAVISQAPHVSGIASTFAVPALSLPGLVAAALDDKVRAALGQAPRYVRTVGRPGTLATLTQPGAWEGYQRLVAGNPAWPNRVAARIALQLPFYSPGDSAPRSTAPTMISVEQRDNLTPAAAAVNVARRMNATLIRYPNGHFDVYQGGPDFGAAVRDQLAFLASHVPVPAPGAAG